MPSHSHSVLKSLTSPQTLRCTTLSLWKAVRILFSGYTITLASKLQNTLILKILFGEDLQHWPKLYWQRVAATKFEDCDILAFLSECAVSRFSESICGFPSLEVIVLFPQPPLWKVRCGLGGATILSMPMQICEALTKFKFFYFCDLNCVF